MYEFSEFFIYKANSCMAIFREDGLDLGSAFNGYHGLDDLRTHYGYDFYDSEGPTKKAKIDAGSLKLKACDLFFFPTSERSIKYSVSKTDESSYLYFVLNRNPTVPHSGNRFVIIMHWNGSGFDITTKDQFYSIDDPSHGHIQSCTINSISLDVEFKTYDNIISVTYNKGFVTEVTHLFSHAISTDLTYGSSCFQTADYWIINNLERIYNFDVATNPLDFGVAKSIISFCTIDNGTAFNMDRLWSKITIWLYEALVDYQLIQDVVIRTLGLVFPSGLTLGLILNGEVQDFRHYPQKYWAYQVVNYSMNYKSSPIPLPHMELTDNYLLSLFTPFNDGIAGSEDQYFKDQDTGEIKKGTEFNPIRQYHPISDGVVDVETINLVISIGFLIHHLGLIKLASGFVSKALAWFRARQLRSNIDTINDNIINLTDNVSELPFDELDESIKGLASKIGLRFTLRT